MKKLMELRDKRGKAIADARAILDKAEAEKRDFGYKDEEGNTWDATFTKWEFSDEAPLSTPKASIISFNFWDGKPYTLANTHNFSVNCVLPDNSLLHKSL